MTTKIEAKINYLTAKRKYKRLLRESNLLTEQRWEPGSAPAYGAFVKPFADVFKALKLTAMDIGNSARLVLGTLLSFSPEALKKTRDKFVERRGLLRAEWDPIVKDSLDSIKSADPLLALFLMPQVYLASLGMAAGVTTGKSVAEVLSGERWKRLIERLERMPNEKYALNKILGLLDEKKVDKDKGILGKLSKLFFSESVLREQQEKEKTKTATKYDTSSEDAWLKSFFADTGLNVTFDNLVTESAKNHLSITKEVAATARRAEVGALLVAATNPEDFKAVLIKATKNGILEAANVKELSGVLSQIEQQAGKLVASEEFRKKMAKIKNTEVDQLNDNDVKRSAQQAAFNAGKTDFNQQAVNGSGETQGIQALLEEVKKGLETISLDNETLLQMKKRTDLPAVKQLLNIYESASKSYDKAQQALSGAKKVASKSSP